MAFKSQSEITVYEEWEDHLKKSFANAKYCVLVIELESLLFMFVKSLRLADFSLFVTCLKEMIISVSFRSYTSWTMDVGVYRKSARPSIYAWEHLCFSKGYFAVKKSKRKFPNIEIEQATSWPEQ